VELIAQADRQGQVRTNAPFVLNEAAIVITERFAVRAVLSEIRLVHESQQHLGDRIRVAGASRKASEERVVAVFVAQKERDVVLIIHAAEFEAALDRMPALDPRDVIVQFEDAIVLNSGMSWGGGASEKSREVKRRDTAQPICRWPGKSLDAKPGNDR